MHKNDAIFIKEKRWFTDLRNIKFQTTANTIRIKTLINKIIRASFILYL